MITYDKIIAAQNTISEFWGEDGKRVIAEAARVTPFNKGIKEFLDHCTACGGNWGGMLLTGLKELYLNVWEAIPDDMGPFAWQCICSTMILCGVDDEE